MELIEKSGEFSHRLSRWNGDEKLSGYPFVENSHAPFTPVQRALPMLNLALVSLGRCVYRRESGFRYGFARRRYEFSRVPIEVGPEGLKYAAKGYYPAAVQEDRNAQIPIERLLENPRQTR